MKVLAVTGKLAEKDVRKYAESADIYVVDIDVAAFITPHFLEKLDLQKYDLVLVPGLTRGQDWEGLERKKGSKIRLGPIHAYDLKFLMPVIDKVELSHEIPACRLISKIKAEESFKLVDELEEHYSFKIKNTGVGGSSRMKVVAEIVDATKLTEEKLIEKIKYYEESGADIIDLGLPLVVNPDEVMSVVEIAQGSTDLPVSVDTFNVEAIKAAVEAGVDMVMSISETNMEALKYIDDRAVVVVERDLNKLVKLLGIVREHTDRVIADPVLDPPYNVFKSISRYAEFRELDEETPLLFGIGNITELVDADSIGINALLAVIGEEIGVNLLFTTEASSKSIGSVKELYYSSYMAKAAKIRNTTPKDLGISLLVLKDKVKLETCGVPEGAIEAEENAGFIRDPMGDFRIWVKGNRIVCGHEKIDVVGKSAKEIYDTVIKKGLISRLDHAAYLGKELEKAEIAVLLRKNYTQDQELDFGVYGWDKENGWDNKRIDKHERKG
jgi:dihydropteroate synthase-like protein